MEVSEWLGKDNTLGIDIWEKKYCYNGESFDDWVDRLSKFEDKELSENIRRMILEKKFLYGGRILANRGTGNGGTCSNCFCVSVDDSLQGIYKTAQDMALTYKAGGGVGVDISSIAPAGAKVNNPAKTSTGAVSFIELFTTTTGLIGQCIEGKQRVLTPKGLVPIEDISVDDFVWTKNGYKRVIRKLEQGEKEIYSVKTRCGYSIKTTGNHEFCTTDGNTVVDVQLDDLDIGDRIVLLSGVRNDNKEYIPLTHTFEKKKCKTVNQTGLCEGEHMPCYMDCRVPDILNEDIAYLLGYIIGNGWNSNGGISVSCDSRNTEQIEKILSLGDKVFGHTPSLRFVKGEHTVKIAIGGVEIGEFMRTNGFEKKKAKDIFIPEKIWNSKSSVQGAYIAGYFDADGTMSKKGGISITSISRRMIEDVQTLLSANGILSKIYVDAVKHENWALRYKLYVTGRVNTERMFSFMEMSVKTKKKDIRWKRDGWLSPYSAKGAGIPYNNFSYVNGLGLMSINCISKLVAEGYMDEEILALDTIAEITPCGVAKTYDITLEEENRFWCEGFYIHNSGRRGALMISMACDHPDIEEFIKLKTDVEKATTANLSIRVSDNFMKAVEYDENWFLAFTRPETGECISRSVPARELFKQFCDANYDYGEPGMLFWDRITSYNMVEHFDDFKWCGINPCGEQPLPDGGACLLGSLNLAEYVDNDTFFDLKGFAADVRYAVRALSFIQQETIPQLPLEKQRETAKDWRQIGLGVMGVGDMLIKMNIKYGSDKSVQFCNEIGCVMATYAIIESSKLGEEYGSYPKFRAKEVNESEFIKRHPSGHSPIKAMFNSQLLCAAPTGSISTMIGVSGGIEPLYALKYTRTTKSLDNKDTEYVVEPDVVVWARKRGLTDGLVCAQDIPYKERIAMQAAWQRHMDAAISSTVNLPEDFPKDKIGDIYMEAWREGLKGVTIFRDGCKRAGILNTKKEKDIKEVDSSQQIGLKRTLITGCGNLHCTAFFDRKTGALQAVYLNKGSQGGCANHMVGVSRLISLSARAGCTIEEIVDQLKSCGSCPSYAVRRATKGDTSVGSCCPMAVGNALIEMHDEMMKDINTSSSMKEPEKKVKAEVKNPCPQCGAELAFTNSCSSCPACGYTRCG